MSDALPRRPPLLAAVLLSASIGLVGGAAAAWGIYHRFGPVERVASAVGPGGGSGGGGTSPSTYASIADAVAPSLVTVVTRPLTTSDLVAGGAGLSTGFVASSDGLVVTSARALGGATRLELAYSDGEVIAASVASSDPTHGVVVLRAASAPAGHPAPLGFTDFAHRAPRAGDLVIAVGSRPLSGLSVTAGTVRAVGCAATPEATASSTPAPVGEMSIDATPAPQDEGAPLLDAAGQVVGIVTDGGGASLTALDGRSAADLVGSLVRGRIGTPPSFGAQSCLLDAAHAGAVGARAGALVVAVTTGGPAEIAGLRRGDVVTAVDATAIDGEHPLDAIALGLSAGQRVQVFVLRDGQELELGLTVH